MPVSRSKTEGLMDLMDGVSLNQGPWCHEGKITKKISTRVESGFKTSNKGKWTR